MKTDATGRSEGDPVELTLNTRVIWKCRGCGHRQDAVENEEWPVHCEQTMKIGAVWGLSA